MKNDPELEVDEGWTEESIHSSRQRNIGTGGRKPLRILLAIFLVLIVTIGILYFISRLRTGGEASILQSRVNELEQKIKGLEQQLVDLEGKMSTVGTDPALLQRLETLGQKVEELEKPQQPAFGSKAKLSVTSKPAVSSEKQYHTVQKGETLYRISRKYHLSVEELQKLNDLAADQPLRAGQKLLVSP